MYSSLGPKKIHGLYSILSRMAGKKKMLFPVIISIFFFSGLMTVVAEDNHLHQGTSSDSSPHEMGHSDHTIHSMHPDMFETEHGSRPAPDSGETGLTEKPG